MVCIKLTSLNFMHSPILMSDSPSQHKSHFFALRNVNNQNYDYQAHQRYHTLNSALHTNSAHTYHQARIGWRKYMYAPPKCFVNGFLPLLTFDRIIQFFMHSKVWKIVDSHSIGANTINVLTVQICIAIACIFICISGL